MQEVAYLEPVQLAQQLVDRATVDRQALYRMMYHDGTEGGDGWSGARLGESFSPAAWHLNANKPIQFITLSTHILCLRLR